MQEAYVAALRKKPDADRPLRPWLARVVVNAVRKMRRGGVRRLSRERVAARPEALPLAEARRDRERLLRVLLDGVLALPDVEREAVLLRHYEALPPRAIAARLGVPVEQVYTRLERALARLRSRLDAAHQGERRAWMLGLSGTFGVPASLQVPGSSAGAAAGGSGGAAVGTATSTLTGAILMTSTAITVTAVVVSLAAGLGVGWFVGQQNAPNDAAPAARPESSRGGGTLAAGDAARPELVGQDPAVQVAALRQQLTAAKESLTAREKEVAELKTQVAAASHAPFDAKALRFGLTGATPTFDKADWAGLSGHVVELAKALGSLPKAMRDGGQPGPEIMAVVAEHNTPLAIFAVTASAELKGTGPNGAYTHPAVIANLIRAALIAANDPLTASQEASIVTLGNAWAAESERTDKSFPDGTPDLARTVAEVDGKQRFLDNVKLVLSPSQRGHLFNPETEGRMQLDLLSPALVYIAMAPVESVSADDLAAQLVPKLLRAAGIKDVDPAPLLSVGQRWLDDVPGGRDAHPARDPELMFPSSTLMQAWARAEVAAIQRIAESGRLTPEQVKAVRRVRTLLMPYVVKAG